MRLSVIVAVAENGVVGKDNALPWYLPADLQYFKKMTMGKPIVSTEIGGAKDLKDVIRIAGTPSEFLAAMEKALRPCADEDVLRRKNMALHNSWHNRIKELETLTKTELSKYHKIRI